MQIFYSPETAKFLSMKRIEVFRDALRYKHLEYVLSRGWPMPWHETTFIVHEAVWISTSITHRNFNRLLA